MSALRIRSSALALTAAAALALGACGGDDGGGGGGGDTAGLTTLETTPRPTGTGTTTREGTGTTGERTTTSERGDDKGGRDRSGSGGGSDDSGQSGGAGQTLSPQGNDVYSVARRVCNQFLPLITAKQLKEGKTTPEKVARDYSRAFPKRQVKRAHDGCLKGLDDRG
jgi:hypothetical protein